MRDAPSPNPLLVQLCEVLRSGEYRKGKGVLRRVVHDGGPDEFCVLGVLADLVEPTEWVKPTEWVIWNDRWINSRGSSAMPSERVLRAAGLNDLDAVELYRYNDNHHSWKPVIRYIEKKYCIKRHRFLI